MPIPGAKPSEQHRHRVKSPHEWIEVERVPFEGGPSLPRIQPGEPSWPRQTRHWWGVISRMAHCCLWDEADWQFALDTAVVAAAFHRGDLKAARELRQREKIMGTTMDARRDLRIRYVDPKPEGERPGLIALAEYKRELGLPPETEAKE